MELDSRGLLTLGILLVVALVSGIICGRLGLPRVLGYLFAGVLCSPDLAGGWLALDVGGFGKPLASIALGIVAYLIGGAVTPRQTRRVGKTIVAAALGGTIGPTIAVTLGVWALQPEVGSMPAVHLALALGVIAATTDPASTVAILHQFRARGLLSGILLGVVAVDDAFGLLIYALVFAFAFGGSLADTVGTAFVEIFGALACGAAVGYVVTLIARWVREPEIALALALAGIVLTTGVAETLHFSPLLAAMCMGYVCRAALADGGRLFAPIERLEELVFAVFFVLAGSLFEVAAFAGHLDLVAACVALRMGGKTLGVWGACRLARSPRPVGRWLGFGLIPQAGVAMGLALSIANQPAFEGTGSALINIVLATVLVNEVAGPLLTRFALSRARELGRPRSRRHR